MDHLLPCTGCVTHTHCKVLPSSSGAPDGPRNGSQWIAQGNPDSSRRLYPCKACASQHWFAFLGVKPNCCLPDHPAPLRKFWGAAMARAGGTRAPSQFPISFAGFRELFHPACFAPTNTSTSLQSLVLLLIHGGVPAGTEKHLHPRNVGGGGGTSPHDLGSSGDLGSAGTETPVWGLGQAVWSS